MFFSVSDVFYDHSQSQLQSARLRRRSGSAGLKQGFVGTQLRAVVFTDCLHFKILEVCVTADELW